MTTAHASGLSAVNAEAAENNQIHTKDGHLKDTAPVEIERGLEVARDLARHGIPIFVAKPATDATGEWDPHGGHSECGYWMPPKWQQTPADPATVDAWRPGDALAMVCGHGVDAVDEDPRSGGDQSVKALTSAGMFPLAIGQQATPSDDGKHYLVDALHVRSLDSTMPGMDVKAGHEGQGIGFIFIAPTRKAAKGPDGKPTGKIGGYSWTVEPNLDEMDAADDSGAALAGIINDRRSGGQHEDVDPYEGPTYAMMPADEQRRLMAFIDGKARGRKADLTPAADWPEGHRPGGTGWEKLTADEAFHWRMVASMPWSPLDQWQAHERYLQCLPQEFKDALDVEGKWKAQGALALAKRTTHALRFPEDRDAAAKRLGSGGDTPTVQPQTKDDGKEDTSGDGKRGRTHAHLVIGAAREDYRAEITPDGQPFAVPLAGPPLAIPLGAKGGALRARIAKKAYDDHGVVVGSDALTNGLTIFMADAYERTTPCDLHLRVADLGDMLVIDLGQPGTMRCVIVTADGWTVEDEPPSGVYFRRPRSLAALPTPVHDGSLEPLRALLGFAATDQRWHLTRGWLAVALRGSIPRPILLPIGAPGTGKTTRAHLIVNVLDPREHLGSSFGRNLDDDQVKALSRYLVGYDNLTTVSEPVSDHLCRLVTGDAPEKRKNYEDTEAVVLSYRRTGVVTAVTLPALRADALERVIPMHLERLSGQRRAEAALWADFEQAHPGVLGAVLDDAVVMLRNLPQTMHRTDGPRMLDYWASLLAIDEELATAYAGSADDILADAAEGDPIVVMVREWLRAFPRDERSGEPADEFASLDTFARRQGLPSGYWPPNQKAMSTALEKASNTLAAVGITFSRSKSNGRRVWRFTLDEEQGR